MRDLFFMMYVRMYEGISLSVFARTSVYAHEHIPTATSFFVNPFSSDVISPTCTTLCLHKEAKQRNTMNLNACI